MRSLEEWATQTLNVILPWCPAATPQPHHLWPAEFNQILTNFAPRAKQRAKMKAMPQDGEIDILIATDCISEGQNLQDCDCWSTTTFTGTRCASSSASAGSTASAAQRPIQLVNFWPTPDLNKYINLKNRVEARMALVDIAATNEDNILPSRRLEELIQQDLKLPRQAAHAPEGRGAGPGRLQRIRGPERIHAGRFPHGPGGKLVSSQTAIKATTDFDLITWLVIKNEQ
jgi:hypothetical protein